MGATVFLDTPMDGNSSIECEEVKVIGEFVLARQSGEQSSAIPQSNVTGITGDDVEQQVDEVEYAGGRITQRIMRIS